jgi:hypothetical protein
MRIRGSAPKKMLLFCAIRFGFVLQNFQSWLLETDSCSFWWPCNILYINYFILRIARLLLCIFYYLRSLLLCIFYYLYVDSLTLTYAFGWSAFMCRIRFCDTLVVIFFKQTSSSHQIGTISNIIIKLCGIILLFFLTGPYNNNFVFFYFTQSII